MKVKIENAYSDGHESEKVVEIVGPEPAVDDLDVERERTYGNGDVSEVDWWEAAVSEHCGDGHGNGDFGKLGYYHGATIVEADNPELVGQSYEWSGI